MTDGRVDKLREILVQKKLDAVLVTDHLNRNYLSGFTGSTAFLFIAKKKAYFVTDARYTEQAKKEVSSDFEHVELKTGKDYYKLIAGAVKDNGVATLAFESKNLVLAQFEKLKKHLPKVLLRAEESLVEVMREVKSEEELQKVRQAVIIAEKAFAGVLSKIKPGVKELDIAAELEYLMRLNGSEGSAFSTIVASGERGAMPHGLASEKRLKNKELIVIDFGAVYKGYCSDLTRTVGLGIISGLNKNRYKVVYEAQQKAVLSIKSGISLSIPDKKARNYLKKHGMEKYFTHGLGHGLGRNVHEAPSIGSKNKGILKSGMVVTIEPGVYFPGEAGIRIENDIIVKETGCEFLGNDQRRLVVL